MAVSLLLGAVCGEILYVITDNKAVIIVFFVMGLLFLVSSTMLIIVSSNLEESDRLKAAKKQAEDASKAKSYFLASMSHEIRTPINTVLGMDELIVREARDPIIKQYAVNIRNAGNTLLSIINDILDFSKLEAGKLETVNAEYDLSAVITELVGMIKARADKKGLKLNVIVNPDMPHILVGDAVRIKQCVINLLSNAVKYTKEGEVTLKVNYSPAYGETILMEVSVADTGVGIKKEDMDRLFTPFVRVGDEENLSIEGSGLGMTIVKNILSIMDSVLNVDSEYGVGSEFYFTLKQEVKDWEKIGNYEETYKRIIGNESVYQEQFTAPNARILIVDDMELNLSVAEGLLKKTRIRIDTALGARAALKYIEKNEYDILFIDHRMPEIDGIELLHMIRKDRGNINSRKPCIALTANALVGAKDEYLKEGFEDYLSKPINSSQLEKMLLLYLPWDKVETAPGDNELVSTENTGESNERKEDALRLRVLSAGDAELLDALKLLWKREKSG